VLGRLGGKCIRAIDGQSALQAARRTRLTLAMLDAKLPDMDGLELARQIRASDPHIAVLIVSGYFYKDDPAIQSALAEELIRGFVAKPFSHKEILAALEAAPSSQEVASGAADLAAC
jgi:CheY-like chemotaxis protein